MTCELKFLHFDVLDSTSLHLRQMSERLVPITVVSADFQTGGRGRGDRKWHSPPGGCAMFSMLLEKRPEWDYNALSSLSVNTARLVAEWLKVRYGIAATVKKPNDVLVEGRKICGILIEEASGKIIVGVGLNTNLEPSELTADGGVESLGKFCGTIIENRSLIEELARYLAEGLYCVRNMNGEEKTE